MQIQDQNITNTAQTLFHPKKNNRKQKNVREAFPYTHLMFNPNERIIRLVSHCREIFQAVTFVSKFVGVFEEALEQNVQKLSECLE